MSNEGDNSITRSTCVIQISRELPTSHYSQCFKLIIDNIQIYPLIAISHLLNIGDIVQGKKVMFISHWEYRTDSNLRNYYGILSNDYAMTLPSALPTKTTEPYPPF